MIIFLLSQIFTAAIFIIQIGYPAYQTLKSFSKQYFQQEWIQWLMYWCTYATITMFEEFLFLNYLPYFWFFKMLFLLWLIHPTFEGASYLHKKVIDRIFSQVDDTLLVKIKAVLEKIPIGKKESAGDDDAFKNSAAAAAMRSLDDKKD